MMLFTIGSALTNTEEMILYILFVVMILCMIVTRYLKNKIKLIELVLQYNEAVYETLADIIDINRQLLSGPFDSRLNREYLNMYLRYEDTVVLLGKEYCDIVDNYTKLSLTDRLNMFHQLHLDAIYVYEEMKAEKEAIYNECGK